MSTFKVDYITRHGADPDSQIDAIGGVGFYHLTDEAIGYIQRGAHIYYTLVDNEVALLSVKEHPVSRTPLLQTIGDNYPQNRLLELPECRQSLAMGGKRGQA